MILWFSLALAQDASLPSVEVADEITVYGEAYIRQARAEVVRAIEGAGWTALDRRPGGVVIFKPPENWIGRVRLTPEGELLFGTRLAGVQWADTSLEADYPPHTRAAGAASPTGPMDQNSPMGASTGEGAAASVLPAPRKQRAVQERLRAQVQPVLDSYRQVLWNTHFEEQLRALPDALDALWNEGKPLEVGEESISGVVARKGAILAYWASRTDTREGERVCSVVETWIRETVQDSDDPFIPAEITDVTRPDGRVLDLSFK